MSVRLPALLFLALTPSFGAEWNPKLVAEYLDGRQKEWFAWPTAMATGVPCMSCHTGLTYLLVRPVLRRALHEDAPTVYERGLVDGLKSRLDKMKPEELAPRAKDPSQPAGVESVMAALALAGESSSALSADGERAFRRMWSFQIASGKNRGAWGWFSLDLDPWETAASPFYGASLAALAVGNAPENYRKRPEIRANLAALKEYFQAEAPGQPLHNRLMLVWASTRLDRILAPAGKKKIMDELWSRQQPEGGWTMASLGEWTEHAAAPPSSGINAYATAFAAYVAQQSGVKRSDPRLVRAIEWLRKNQNPEGYWEAMSMNKPYPAGSMQIRFMRDAATAFAALVLAGTA